MGATRKIAAIVAADVVGYSRLAAFDEDRTLARLRSLRSDLLDPVMSVHKGRIVKRTGDGVLAEFRSVVDAVRCSIEIQTALAERNAGVPADNRIDYRFGIHLGDVVEEDDGDLMGDGVNIAARLEGICNPRGILISEDAYRQVRDKVQEDYVDLGERELKNIPRPMRVYSISLDKKTTQREAFRSSFELPKPASAEARQSIAVLPFNTMGIDPEQEFFADGLTEDLITALSKGPGLFVIARHSSFVFKNKPLDVRLIAKELGVRYILEGSARRAANRIRINAQLVDARDGTHLWAERYDRQLADMFTIQDEVVGHIVEALVGRLALAAMPERSVPTSIEAYDLFVRGRFLHHKMSASHGIEARKLFSRAVDLDPSFADARAYLAMTHWLGWSNWFEPVDPNRRLAIEHAKFAVSTDPNNPFAHTVLGHVINYERQFDEAAKHFEQALLLDPNHAETYAMRTDLLVMHGRPNDALLSIAEAIKLNPHPPPFYYWLKGEAEYAHRQYEKALITLRTESTYATGSRSILAAALAQLGRREESQIEGRLFMADYPRFTITEFFEGQPFKYEEDLAHFVEGYRLAGIPEF